MLDRKPLLGVAALLVFAAGFGLGYVVRAERAAASEASASDASEGSSPEVLAGPEAGASATDGGAEGSAEAAAGSEDEGPRGSQGEGDVAVVGATEGSSGPSSAALESGGGAPLPAAGDGGAAPGRLNASSIRNVVREHRDEIGFCFAWQLHYHPELEGSVTMEFVIGPDGSVTDARVAEDALGDETVLRCFVGVTRRMQFTPPENGEEVTVRYPFHLSPDDEESTR